MNLFYANRSLLSVIPFALLVLVVLICPPDIFAAEPTGQAVQASSAPTTLPSAQIPREVRNASYSLEAVGLVAGVFVLLAVLFVILLWWAGRLERTSYLGTLYRDTVEDLEYRRLIAPMSEKFANNGYVEDILQDKDWLTANPQPNFPAGRQFFRQHRRTGPIPAEVPEGPSITWGSGTIGGQPPSTPEEAAERAQRTREELERSRQQRDQIMREYEQLKRQYEDWEARVEDEGLARYRSDQQAARTKAAARADESMNVDLAVLRGRGAEFVLEFTTIVVLIFAAIALGILGILETQQIGTLLAAIAGYVLGRASTRTRGTPGAGGGA
jgi:hypothetical protein